jgi:hypothetical protein
MASRRRTQWAEFDQSGITTGAIGHGINTDILANFRATGGDTAGTTILRTHLKLFVTSAVAAGDGFKAGLIVTSLGNVGGYTTGGGVFFDPVDSPYLPWMLVMREGAHPGYGTTSPNANLEYDIKAKRRVPQLDSTLILSVVNTGAVAALTYSVYARVLLAMP